MLSKQIDISILFKNRYLKLNLLSTNRIRMKKAKRIEKKVIIEDSIEGKIYKIIKENGTRGITFEELLVKSHVSEIELKNCIRKLLWENFIFLPGDVC